MGFFKKTEVFPEPKPTRLDREWFMKWAGTAAENVTEKSSSELQGERVDAADWFLTKSLAVLWIDQHDYVQRYCSAEAVMRYAAFFESPEVTPWDLMSVAATLNSRANQWMEFLDTDAESKLNNFAKIALVGRTDRGSSR